MGKVPERFDAVDVSCGLMGAALARRLAGTGHSIGASNRSHERAEALSADGAILVRDIADAVRRAGPIIACMLIYETTLVALDPVDSWDGKTLVNLATGSCRSPTWVLLQNVEVGVRGSFHSVLGNDDRSEEVP